jgi:hypothetical protein
MYRNELLAGAFWGPKTYRLECRFHVIHVLLCCTVTVLKWDLMGSEHRRTVVGNDLPSQPSSNATDVNETALSELIIE